MGSALPAVVAGRWVEEPGRSVAAANTGFGTWVTVAAVVAGRNNSAGPRARQNILRPELRKPMDLGREDSECANHGIALGSVVPD